RVVFLNSRVAFLNSTDAVVTRQRATFAEREAGEAMETIVAALARYASGLTYDRLPAAVVEKAKVCILDAIGIAAGGSASENAAVALRAARHLASDGPATVWMSGERMRAIDAVLPNSVATHCILQDDWLQVSHSHIGAAVVPSAIAMA